MSDILPALLRKPLGKNGSLLMLLLERWADVVGQEYVELCSPAQLRKQREGQYVLIISVSPEISTELHYATPQILERCNRMWGAQTITRIHLQQRALAIKTSTSNHAPKQLRASANPVTLSQQIDDPELCHALEALSSHLLR